MDVPRLALNFQRPALLCRIARVNAHAPLKSSLGSRAGIDPYKQSRRFSPRRGHVAVTVYPSGSTLNNLHKPVIVVLGGRAKSYERMSGNELAGERSGRDRFDFLTDARTPQPCLLAKPAWQRW